MSADVLTVTPTLPERAMLYNRSDWGRRFPASRLAVVEEQGGPVLYGRWLIGAMFANASSYYGAFPRTLLERLDVMWPDAGSVLHVFSGSLRPGRYLRLDINPAVQPELIGSVYDVRELFQARYPTGGTFLQDLVIADPPYTERDAERYGTPMVDRRRATAALATVTRRGGHLAWLDTVWPMHNKRDWRTCGRIAITRSTNHRLRDLTIFERQSS